MFKYLSLFLLPVILILGCSNNPKLAAHHSALKQNLVKRTQKNIPLTDSAKPIKLLDSLPKAVFPSNSSSNGSVETNISLKDFKNKRLFKIPYKLIPRQIVGASIDNKENEEVDTTFDLCDSATFKSHWILVTKTPKFFAVEVESNYLLLVTLDYHLNFIDAIHIDANDPSSNANFHGWLASTIYKNLKIIMHYSYDVRTDEEGHFETTNEDDIWRIDKNGKFIPVDYTKME